MLGHSFGAFLMVLLAGVAVAAGLQAQISVATATDRGRGIHLYRACQSLDRVGALPAGQKASAEDTAAAHECWGYIEGWMDALLDGSGAMEQRGICPSVFTIPEVAHAYVVHVEKHKELMVGEAGTALRAALKSRFPCGKK